MAIKISKGELIFAILLLILHLGCNKNGSKPCPRTVYVFSVTSEWHPQREIYNIGDTIYLNSIFPKVLFENTLNYNIDYTNSIGIGGDISIYYLDTITHQPIPAKDSFGYISIVGNFSERPINKDQGMNTNYIEMPLSYHFRGGIICKKKGIYSFGVADLGSRGLVGKNCTNAGFTMKVTNTNKHLYLHQYALNVDPNDPELQRSSYDFRVQ